MIISYNIKKIYSRKNITYIQNTDRTKYNYYLYNTIYRHSTADSLKGVFLGSSHVFCLQDVVWEHPAEVIYWWNLPPRSSFTAPWFDRKK